MLVTDIVLNADNPREITPDKLELLVQSILVFPKMLAIRPVVADAETHVVYGGNMRTRALSMIQQLDKQEIVQKLEQQTKYKRLTSFEQQELQEYWAKWQKRPLVRVQLVSDLRKLRKPNLSLRITWALVSGSLTSWQTSGITTCWQNGAWIYGTTPTRILTAFLRKPKQRKRAKGCTCL